MPLSHAPLAGVAWAASIVSLDSAARVSKRFVPLTGQLLAELAGMYGPLSTMGRTCLDTFEHFELGESCGNVLTFL